MYQGSHKANILSILNSDRNAEESYCDVTLEVEGKHFRAHKCIVGKLSSFFHTMFKIEMKEKYSTSIHLEQIKPKTMKTILDFMYTATLGITDKNVVDILKVANYLQMNEVKSFCVDFLKKSLDQSNCLEYCILGRSFDAVILHDSALQIVVENFESVSKKEGFNKLDKKDLCIILETIGQKVSVTKRLYIAAITWIKYDLVNRKQHLMDLLKLINLHLFPTSFIKNVVANETLIKESNECLHYLLSKLLSKGSLNDENFFSSGGELGCQEECGSSNEDSLQPSRPTLHSFMPPGWTVRTSQTKRLTKNQKKRNRKNRNKDDSAVSNVGSELFDENLRRFDQNCGNDACSSQSHGLTGGHSTHYDQQRSSKRQTSSGFLDVFQTSDEDTAD